jgi:hypothetical protein
MTQVAYLEVRSKAAVVVVVGVDKFEVLIVLNDIMERGLTAEILNLRTLINVDHCE